MAACLDEAVEKIRKWQKAKAEDWYLTIGPHPNDDLTGEQFLALAEVVKAARPFQRPVAAQTLGEYQRLDNALARLEEQD